MKTLETITTICGSFVIIIASIIILVLFIGLLILLIDELKENKK